MMIAVFVSLSTVTTLAIAAIEFGTPSEARALLTRAVDEIRKDKSDALSKFNSGAEGFKDRDLYVFCIGADGVATAGPTKGQNMTNFKDKRGKMIGQEFMKVAKEGVMNRVEYVWPRPGRTEAIQKVSFVTKVEDQVCGVGYYK